MNGEATINTSITFVDGVISSSLVNILKIADNAIALGASDASYVDGYVQKIGNDAFTFPVGQAGFYAPCAISAPSSTSDAFNARYKHVVGTTDGYDINLFMSPHTFIYPMWNTGTLIALPARLTSQSNSHGTHHGAQG